jgi:hypothetical protein
MKSVELIHDKIYKELYILVSNKVKYSVSLDINNEIFCQICDPLTWHLYMQIEEQIKNMLQE